jgi:hypothetical protein
MFIAIGYARDDIQWQRPESWLVVVFGLVIFAGLLDRR